MANAEKQPAPAGAEQWVSVQEAARIMGVTEVWVLRRLNAGDLPGFKINQKAWCVSLKACVSDVSDYNRSRRAGGRVGRPRTRT